ncbi:chemotaxis protein CheA [Marinitoga litoralis]|uniref:chemotaxis protein CheA n=1 Tax=Marinitoga litoralis TaxID=570855 RepID=UPI00196175C8|nr:chemotaxis protein CheA [Marinitoga litoralis]MBM7558581.1 two-component system chemotaxis sensor kinase CheA [Marinitoga litoralis]
MKMHFDDKFINDMLKEFSSEAQENINLIEVNLVNLEESGNMNLINTIMRGFHTLKGSSRLLLSMDIPEKYTKKIKKIEEISHKLEDLSLTISSKDDKNIDLLYDGLDLIKKITNSFIDENVDIDISNYMINFKNIDVRTEKKPKLNEVTKKMLIDLKEQFFEYLLNAENYNMSQINRMKKPLENTLKRFGNDKLTNKFQEIIKCVESNDKNSIRNAITEFDNILFNKQSKEFKIEFSDTVRVDVKKINTIMNLVSELVTIKNTSSYLLKELYKVSPKLHKEYTQVFANLDKITINIQDQILSLKMTPIKELLFRYKRLIRELSKEKNKEISYEFSGENIEIDRILLENLSDPLTHIIRNAIDHGIETPQERKSLGKNEEGLIKINVFYESGYVFIEIIDDGKGIDIDKIKERAKELGYDINIPDEEIINYIFEPGFSTAKEVTEISGRGVGMDIVKNNIEKLNGKVYIETKKNQGTKITLKIPNSIINIDGVMVLIDNEKYIFPFEEIDKIIKVNKEKIHNYSNQIFVEYNEEIIPVFSGIIENKKYTFEEIINKEYKNDLIPIILIDNGNAGLLVDEIIEENEFLVKPLPEFLKYDFIYGSTILGNGDIVLILKPSEMVIQWQK